MSLQVRIVQEGFCLGSTLLPVGYILPTNAVVGDYLVRSGKAEVYDPEADERQAHGTYHRTDMQAEQPGSVAQEAAPPPVKSKRKRRTKAEMEEARKNGTA